MGAENGQVGLDSLNTFTPDIILLDMMMPVMGGLEFMEAFKKLDHAAEVIVFSNISAPGQMQAVMELGAAAYWIKSDYTPELVIDGIMKRWKTRQTARS